MVGVLIFLTLLGGITVLAGIWWLGSYIAGRIHAKDMWEDEQAEYAKNKARQEWEQIIRNTQGKP